MKGCLLRTGEPSSCVRAARVPVSGIAANGSFLLCSPPTKTPPSPSISCEPFCTAGRRSKPASARRRKQMLPNYPPSPFAPFSTPTAWRWRESAPPHPFATTLRSCMQRQPRRGRRQVWRLARSHPGMGAHFSPKSQSHREEEGKALLLVVSLKDSTAASSSRRRRRRRRPVPLLPPPPLQASQRQRNRTTSAPPSMPQQRLSRRRRRMPCGLI